MRARTPFPLLITDPLNSLSIIITFFIISSALVVILTKNSINAIIFLVAAYFSSSCLLFLIEYEFFALLILIIYVGAIAVLFLFVVMLLDLKMWVRNNSTNFKYSAFGIFVIISFLFFVQQTFDYYYESNSYDGVVLHPNFYKNFYNEDEMSEIVSIGQILYTQYVIQFLVAGLILSLSVLGVCVLVFQTSLSTANLIKNRFATKFTAVNESLRLTPDHEKVTKSSSLSYREDSFITKFTEGNEYNYSYNYSTFKIR